jgi:NADH-quinone oxidoreductase subunit N
MSLMASSANLIMLYVAIETTSIPLYILAGFLVHDRKSTESGFKYFLFGAMTSTIMLYGFSLLYGFSGTTDIYAIADKIGSGASPIPMIGALLLVLVGFGFKISVVPLHFWAPDVYEGAPTPITGFLSTASKAAGFAVLIRILMAVFPANQDLWSALLAALAVATMTLGNLLALTQKNIKRMLAYSSIAHAGYILIGVVVATERGFSSSIYYLVVYLVTNLAAFAVVTIVSRSIGSEEISDYAGLSRRSPGLALVLLVALLSLAGMPPLGGFIVKFLVFAAAVEANYIWLAVVGVLNAIIGLYYYLVVLKVVYLYRSDKDDQKIAVPSAFSFTLGLLTFGILLLGTLFAPWINWVMKAASSIF